MNISIVKFDFFKSCKFNTIILASPRRADPLAAFCCRPISATSGPITAFCSRLIFRNIAG